MQQMKFEIRQQRQHPPSDPIKLPIITHKKQHLSFSKKSMPSEERQNYQGKLKPLKSSKDLNKSIELSVDSKNDYHNLLKRFQKKKNKRSSIQRIYTEDNQKINEFQSDRILNQEETLTNFHKNVKKNRKQIHDEIRRRNKSDSKSPRSKPHHQFTELVKLKNVGLFQQLKQVLRDNKTNEKQHKRKTQDLQQSSKIVKILSRLKKLHPQKSLYQIRKENSQIRQLKNEGNYIEWRRIEMVNSTPHYKQSCFESEHERLISITTKNQQTLKQYIDGHSQLQKLKELKLKMSA